MGCGSSVPDPNLMYGNQAIHNNRPPTSKNRVHPNQPNGHTADDMGADSSTLRHSARGKSGKGDRGRSSKGERGRSSKGERGKSARSRDPEGEELRGDRWMYQEAVVQREKRRQQQLRKRERKAQDMVEKAMSDKERFSLATTRSRMTSRPSSPMTNRSAATTGNIAPSLTSNDSIMENNNTSVISDKEQSHDASETANHKAAMNNLNHVADADKSANQDSASEDESTPVKKDKHKSRHKNRNISPNTNPSL